MLPIAQLVGPVPPPLPQQTADCDRPTYATDMLVCGDPTLRALDQRLLSRLTSGVPGATGASSSLIEAQEEWFKRSRRCAFERDQRDCVEAAYEERLAVLTAPSTSAIEAGTCRLGDKGHARLLVDGERLIIWRDGAVIAVAFRMRDEWHTFMTYQRTNTSVTIRDLKGRAMAHCRTARPSRAR
ncbi:hypothetical protein KZ820_17985 [Sphingomonas sp. RRHST34]|uniref:Lysozyme inhibitor LprI N-terminal domain-containing protein n=1 Tax=Sphingomonas citri TaxID=2862499 RepID=A0ABS7BSR9_9SPHN|nr:hypothetical protein [Sphingomonas citri]MBW6532636.1 hypothetical protein [Sphingomonas citri]